ncbi:hypothetical protein [Stutzerimonas nitrititolerans]|uniref:hypothetical protein n=1 Tax=Stutzerimonas nitrititolerans TaxID=2482751 RepID=UPI00264A3F95|nr:hypothetical protein [Stutzerimonas nitrititolerans]
MTVLIYSPDGMVSPILYAAAKKYLKLGEKVVFVECETVFSGCSYNLTGSRSVCRYCISKKNKAKNLIDVRDIDIINIGDYVDHDDMGRDIVGLNTFNDFKAYRYKETDLGYSVISTAVNDFREYEVSSYNRSQKKILKKLFDSSHRYVDAVERLMSSIQPSKVVLFNGRLISTRPMLRFCQKNKISCEVYEITPNGKLNVFESTLPHDDYQFYVKAMRFWEESGISQREQASGFFERKRSGEAVGDYSYTAKQHQRDFVFDSCNKKNIVIFNSSPDELIAIGDDYSTGMFDSQAAAVIFLCESLRANEYNIILRLHPNLHGVNSIDVKSLLSLKGRYPHLFVMEPENPVSSYYLLDKADKVVTFGSTMGVEATYWGKTSILLNKAMWGRLNVAHVPNNPHELLKLIVGDERLCDKSGALIFANYIMKYGESDDSFSWSIRSGSTINGQSCEPGFFYRLMYGIYKVRMQALSGNKILVDKFFIKSKRILKG